MDTNVNQYSKEELQKMYDEVKKDLPREPEDFCLNKIKDFERWQEETGDSFEGHINEAKRELEMVRDIKNYLGIAFVLIFLIWMFM